MSDPRNAAHRVSLKLLCISEDKILMLHLIDKRWTLVGGGVDEGESIEIAMKREFFEETGTILDETIIPRLHHVEIEQYPIHEKFSAVVNIYYELHFDKPFDVIVEEGVYREYKWCTLEEALSLETSQLYKKIMKSVVKNY